MLEEVEALAGALREEGVKKGDVVLVYSTEDFSYDFRRDILTRVQCP
jgi:acyl-coenzyme A synthetase/AMP-(fatty) acid ligase